ncbi:hypothetical protein ACWD33_22820 [Streptomyces xiamenensis]|nr:hypothetical protein [Streptomyces xiamenensis]
MFWNRLTPFEAGVRERVTARCQGTDGEVLVRFAPGRDAARPADRCRTAIGHPPESSVV